MIEVGSTVEDTPIFLREFLGAPPYRRRITVVGSDAYAWEYYQTLAESDRAHPALKKPLSPQDAIDLAVYEALPDGLKAAAKAPFKVGKRNIILNQRGCVTLVKHLHAYGFEIVPAKNDRVSTPTNDPLFHISV